ncbi:MAG TPA: zinc ribbon domain-containing protein [Polyangiaceae bacterium]
MKNRFFVGVLSAPVTTLVAAFLSVPSKTLRWVAPLITLITAIILGTLYGVQLVVLTFAAAALLLVIWLLWNSVQALAGESELTFEEAFSLGTRTAEEEQKRAVLRALKDLEYERSVGKISDDDYHEYAARYRAEAKRLIQGLEENLAEGRKQVEAELARRLAKKASKTPENAGSQAKASDESAPEHSRPSDPESAASEPAHSAPESRDCPACQVKNELDARFCKACGKSMTSTEESRP